MTVLMFDQISEEEVKKVAYFTSRLIHFKDSLRIVLDEGSVDMKVVKKHHLFIRRAKLTDQQQQVLFGDVQ